MESWTEDCKLDEWDDEMLWGLRRELIVDIVMGAHNELIEQVRTLLEQNDQRVCHNRT
ncbi:uncharacterized protein DS421_13g423360 [Arachis hypogaea]|nr:uncharacterized protein DS421_13g423360 [Arachis hypogaea]